jgi:hypothetical protein
VLDTSLSEEENKFSIEEPERPSLHAITAFLAEECCIVRLDGFHLHLRAVQVSDVGNVDPGEDE